jgi:LacI family transcriptional regulator
VAQDVKLQDVADAAGVSIATASRARGSKSRVSPESARLVADTARQLGYRVDHIARAMRAGSTRTVGMVVPLIGNPLFAELINGVENELQRHGFELVLADSHADVAQEARRLATLVERRVDGVLIVSQDRRRSDDAIVRAMQSVPVIQIDRQLRGVEADFVGVDNEAGMAMLFDHLRSRGVRSVALVSANDRNSVGVARRKAFEREVKRLGFDALPPVIGSFDVETGVRGAAELAARGVLPDAIVTGADLIAFGVIAGLRDVGLQVPRDVLVTGFDGIEMSAIYNPPLTTVQQPLAAIARFAVQFLLARLDRTEEAPRRQLVRPVLLEHESTARVLGEDHAAV